MELKITLILICFRILLCKANNTILSAVNDKELLAGLPLRVSSYEVGLYNLTVGLCFMYTNIIGTWLFFYIATSILNKPSWRRRPRHSYRAHGGFRWIFDRLLPNEVGLFLASCYNPPLLITGVYSYSCKYSHRIKDKT